MGRGRVGNERGDSSSEHWHPEYWTKEDHHRYEDRIAAQVEKLEAAIHSLTTRVTLMLGGLTLVAVLLPVVAPFVRAWLNVDTPAGQ